MKVKAGELIDLALDWAVAKCEGFKYELYEHNRKKWENGLHRPQHWQPSTDWAQGGPIIGAIKGFEFKHWLESKPDTCCEAHIHNYEGDWIQFGPTQLIAALRCYVASKLGDEVDVPEELL